MDKQLKKIVKKAHKLDEAYCVTDGKRFRLKDYRPGDTGGFGDEAKPRAKAALQMVVEHLATLQDMLYAQDRWSLLLIFQAMDAAGKDGAIKHVMSGINPQGCQVFSFKHPSATELDHDFLWRTTTCLPERGRIGIFNRSYYEEVLVVRVEPGILGHGNLPASLVTKRIWTDRYEDINAAERYLTRNGIAIRKFHLNVSKDEQKKRFLERIEDPAKNWKFSIEDVKKRQQWNDYRKAYEQMLSATSTDYAPWYVVPADRKWYRNLAVTHLLIDQLKRMDLSWPPPDFDVKLEKKRIAAT